LPRPTLPHHPTQPQLLAEIQRTWAYLESLFIGSKEVKRELPDATQRFARIDADIKQVLRVSEADGAGVGCCWSGGGKTRIDPVAPACLSAALTLMQLFPLTLSTNQRNAPPSIAPPPPQEFKATQNCVACCNRDGLLKNLEGQQSALEVCEKALADYMESKRRAFPRFYFVSTADLLDILSNGNSPHKVRRGLRGCGFWAAGWGVCGCMRLE